MSYSDDSTVRAMLQQVSPCHLDSWSQYTWHLALIINTGTWSSSGDTVTVVTHDVSDLRPGDMVTVSGSLLVSTDNSVIINKVKKIFHTNK